MSLGYPWFDDELAALRVLASEAHTNDQVVQRGDRAGNEYAAIARDYGTLGTQPSDLKHYDYRQHEPAIDKLIADHGYEVYYAGGKYGKPNLAERNYTTKHLMVYDPTPGQGGDFGDEAQTRTWRKIHELAHGVTLDELNTKYGEGRRIGKLGLHRTPREAKRAVEWEWLAAHRQRELSARVGHPIDDATFARELNVVMHDAVHRAVTGKFTNPDEEGFMPSDKIVPLEVSLRKIDEAARRMGLKHDDDLLPRKAARLSKTALSGIGEDELAHWLDGPESFFVISANVKNTKSQKKRRNIDLRTALSQLYPASKIKRLRGKWDSPGRGGYQPEPAWLVVGGSFEHAMDLMRGFDQEAVIYKDPSGTVGMYYNDRVDLPSEDGQEQLYGSNAVKVQKRLPKLERRAPPREGDDGDLWTMARNLSFSVKYDKPITVPFDGKTPVVREAARRVGMPWRDVSLGAQVVLDDGTSYTKFDDTAAVGPDGKVRPMTPDTALPDDSVEGPLELAQPVFEVGTPWNYRIDPKGYLVDITTGKRVKPGKTLTEPKLDLESPEGREKAEPLIEGALTPQQRQLIEQRKRDEAARPKLPEDIYTPDRIVPPRSAYKFGDTLKLKSDGGLENILTVLKAARPDEVQYWKEWYDHAGADAQALATKYGVSKDVVAGIIAALSPNLRWDDNVHAAEQILRGQGAKVIEYRRKLDEEAADNFALRVFPELANAQRETLGTFGYLSNITKAQAVLDAYKKHKSFSERASSQNIRLDWSGKNPGGGVRQFESPEEATEWREWLNDEQTISRISAPMARRLMLEYLKQGAVVYDVPRKPHETKAGETSASWVRGEMLSEDDILAGHLPESKRAYIAAPIGGRKVRVFFRSIVDPQAVLDRVVVDGHAINIWRGEPIPLDRVKSPSKSEFDKMVADYTAASKMSEEFTGGVQLSPQQVQAVTWSVWRDATADYMKTKRKKKAAIESLAEITTALGRADERLMQHIAAINDIEAAEVEAGIKDWIVPATVAFGVGYGASQLKDDFMRGYERGRAKHQQTQPYKERTKSQNTWTPEEVTEPGVKTEAPAGKLIKMRPGMMVNPDTREVEFAPKDQWPKPKQPGVLVPKQGQVVVAPKVDQLAGVLASDENMWQSLASAYPAMGTDWAKFEQGQATLDDAKRIVQTLGENVVETFAKTSARMGFEDELRAHGELDLTNMKAGDRVRFRGDFTRPGWPRVDAGTEARVVAVYPDQGMLEVEAVGARAAEGGGLSVAAETMPVTADDVIALVDSRDDRITDYRVDN